MRIDQFISGQAVDQLAGALVLAGLNGSVLDANQAALECYGYSDTEIRALTVRELMAPQQEGQDGEADEGESVGVLHLALHRRSDGTPFPVEIRSAAVSADGQSALLYSVRDITGRKQTETVRQDMMTAVIGVLGSVSEIRDPYTAGHQRKVSELATAMAREMGMTNADVADIQLAGLMHDIGKVSVPAEILSVAGQLSSIQFEVVKDHAEAGYEILSAADLEGQIPELVRQHHERCDGSGYPRGLRADELLSGAKILMVADGRGRSDDSAAPAPPGAWNRESPGRDRERCRDQIRLGCCTGVSQSLRGEGILLLRDLASRVSPRDSRSGRVHASGSCRV